MFRSVPATTRTAMCCIRWSSNPVIMRQTGCPDRLRRFRAAFLCGSFRHVGNRRRNMVQYPRMEGTLYAGIVFPPPVPAGAGRAAGLSRFLFPFASYAGRRQPAGPEPLRQLRPAGSKLAGRAAVHCRGGEVRLAGAGCLKWKILPVLSAGAGGAHAALDSGAGLASR